MATTKVDRVHLREPFDVKANYDTHEGEVVLTFKGGDYPNYKEVVVHFRLWFMAYIVGQLKHSSKQAQAELDEFKHSVSSGV